MHRRKPRYHGAGRAVPFPHQVGRITRRGIQYSRHRHAWAVECKVAQFKYSMLLANRKQIRSKGDTIGKRPAHGQRMAHTVGAACMQCGCLPRDCRLTAGWPPLEGVGLCTCTDIRIETARTCPLLGYDRPGIQSGYHLSLKSIIGRPAVHSTLEPCPSEKDCLQQSRNTLPRTISSIQVL